MIFSLIFIITFLITTTKTKICDVLHFGAKGDGVTDDTSSIQKALDSCTSDSEESIIYLPSSYTFLSYPIRFNKNNLHLWIDKNSTLFISKDFKSKWTYNNSTERYINIIENGKQNLSNLSIFGDGLINGNGEVWWPLIHNKNVDMRPHTIYLNGCKNISIYGITILNSPAYNIYVDKCEDVHIHHINLTCPPFSIAPNTDGIDVGSKNVHVHDCYIANGDDSYCLKAGAENVLIENSVGKQAFCLSSGTGAEPHIYNATFRNMVCEDCECGVKVKAKGSEQDGVMSFITFKNITLKNVEKGVLVNQFNQTGIQNSNDRLKWIDFHDINFIDIKGSYTKWVGHVDCSQHQPCYNLFFQNIDLFTNSQDAQKNWLCSDNVYGVSHNVKPPLSCLSQSLKQK